MTEGIRETEVDGIRTLLAHRPGPVSAGLFFRVGSADETLATRGITHLVEHLALHRHGVGDLHYNGATAGTFTHFHVTGDPSEVVEYLNGVCAALRDLPLERLETEKEILRTEAAGRSSGPAYDMPLWRYGAQGYGLPSYQELGLWRIDATAVRDWAATRFTRENAVLWITSDTVPEGLDLTLPSGPRHPLPAPTSALPHTPAYFEGDDGVVVLDAVVRRSTAASLFADVFGKALYRDLRQEGGYSYTAECDYSPRDAEFATITALSDSLPKKQDAVVGGFIDTLAALRAGRIQQADLDAARNARLKAYEIPDLAAAKLPSQALGVLTGHPVPGDDEHIAELHAVTVEDLHEVAREVWGNALLKVPGYRGADWAGFHEAPSGSPELLTGRRYAYRTDSQTALIIGREGVSLGSPRNQVSVRYSECAAMLAYPDGGRRLIARDGLSISVEPTLYRVSPAELAPIDAAVPAQVVIPMPARSPDRIPQPAVPREAARPAPGWKSTAALWLFAAVALFWGLVAVIGTADEFDPAVTPSPDRVYIAILWLLEGGVLFLLGRTWYRRRQGYGG
ncbi:M16 family metallopeptidase [Streptomyces sp. NPDC059909]|uniref:M16 family metallopeptidase n=1 Tax=Streptomyces sp. NPDC059909 TaxID=3346998 RepID=UPI003662D225